ncbi:MAG: DUF502 domain-containing protein [Pseudomonadota bacterium]
MTKRSEKLKNRPPRQPYSTRLRNYFFTGLVICAPLAITAYLTWTLVEWVDSWVKPYLPDVYNPDLYLPFSVPGFGLLVALFIITIVGFLTANLIGRSIISYGEYLLSRMPVVRNIYSALKQIFETVFREDSDNFQSVILVEYPRKDLWALAFVATDTLGEVQDRLDDKTGPTVSVFLPTTPNPTSGFLLFVPKEDTVELDMSVEEAAKLIISAGLVAPEFQEKQRAALEKAGKLPVSDQAAGKGSSKPKTKTVEQSAQKPTSKPSPKARPRKASAAQKKSPARRAKVDASE